MKKHRIVGTVIAALLVQVVAASGAVAKDRFGAPYGEPFTYQTGTPERCETSADGHFVADIISPKAKACQAGVRIDMISEGGLATLTWHINDAFSIGEHICTDTDLYSCYIGKNGASVCVYSMGEYGCTSVPNGKDQTITTQIWVDRGHFSFDAYALACACGQEGALPQRAFIDATLVDISLGS
jgi:hypothetical protein